MGIIRNSYNILVEKSEGKRPPVSGLDMDGRIVLKWILNRS
jgi:hypothetical protein